MLTVNSTKTKKRRERVSQLKIARFEPSDMGEYKCKAQNYENGTAEVKVVVGKRPGLGCISSYMNCMGMCGAIGLRANLASRDSPCGLI